MSCGYDDYGWLDETMTQHTHCVVGIKYHSGYPKLKSLSLSLTARFSTIKIPSIKIAGNMYTG